ncbi:DHA2 family efflux MFS transporter permease subunit [bacterium]|nr:DHA2 family efflux MFS transporter permease subunit [bacterium]
MSEAAVTEQEWKPEGNPWLAALPTIFAAFMFVLDSTIANVALPHMAGTFSASHDESLWILTSYLVASGIMIPAVDWFSKLLGRRNYFILSILIFTFASFLCAISKSMTMIVCARALQGLGGGGLLPISQAVLLESFPKEKRGKSMAVFGMVVVVAPIIGPVLGGWITDNFDWTWVFLINLPIGLLTAYLAYELMQEPPYAKKQKGNVSIDVKGFLFLIIWLISLQVVLDKGNNLDWFNSDFIRRLAIVSVISMILFFWSQLTNKKSLLDLSVFKDKTFAAGTIIQCVIQAVLLASVALLPQFLQMLMGYSAFLSGLSIMPRGIGACISMVVCGMLTSKVDNRLLAAIGLSFVGLASWWLGNLNLQIASANIAIPNFLFGIGMGFAMIPLVALSVITLKNNQMTNASGLQNLLKNECGAIGTSVAGTFVSRFSQIHQHYLVDNLSQLNTVFQVKFNAMVGTFSTLTDSVTAQAMANYSIYGNMLKQATLWGYMETFRLYALATFIIIPLILVIRKSGLVKKKHEVPIEEL